MRYRFIGISLLAVFLSGCATLFANPSDRITIKTEPPGAEVYNGAESLGTTPLTYTFKRTTFEQPSLTIHKPGYKTKELPLGRTLEPIALFNFGFFLTTSGATSWGIDALTGAMVQYSPSSYFIELEPVGERPVSADLDRRSRLYLVVTGYPSLVKEIAEGDGELLRAYYRNLNTPESYEVFRRRVQSSSPGLLGQADAVELYMYMESRLARPADFGSQADF